MKFFESKNLLLVVPHFKVFIRDQANFLRPHFNSVIILMPNPYFSSLVLMLPYIGRQFKFLRFALESYTETIADYNFISPKFFTLPFEPLRKRNCYLAAKSCVKTLSRNHLPFDLLHAHFLENGFIGASLKGLYNKPFVLTAHGGDVYKTSFKDNWHNALARYVLQEAAQVITVCRANGEKLLSLGVSPNKLHVIPNGYDDKLFKPIPKQVAREKLGLPTHRKILLSVGNLVNVKGHVYLIDAMRFVLKEKGDVILVIVGSGVLRENLEKMTKRFYLNDKVVFVGSKAHEEIPFWMNACDLLILPSLMEGFPTVIPEALACGKPVIASNVGGVPEALSSDELGILVSPKDSEELGWAIINGLDRKWDSNAILHYAKKYRWSELAKQILIVYQEALTNEA